ncbi:VanZ family protein [Bacillus suaedae]|uniref:VanZ family protein n=1 Tax=Halalkalibacter suaedae TaxID=2822140 RepID=A0A940WW33_9BACI|nr:VanZ family protein [Bacillus suaedae]MBP3951547.1 VanZ family protein [Bacillus suaedae]
MGDSVMFTIHSWYLLVPIFFIGLLWLVIWAKRRKERVNPAQFVVLLSFGIYLLCVFHLVFFPIDVNIGTYANQTPWYKSINFFPVLTIDLTTFVLNIIMLVPFGMYLPFLKKTVDSVKDAAKLGFMLSLSFEMIQLLIRITLGSGRSTDINDLLANTAGAAIGYLIIKKLFQVSPIKNLFAKFQL